MDKRTKNLERIAAKLTAKEIIELTVICITLASFLKCCYDTCPNVASEHVRQSKVN